MRYRTWLYPQFRVFPYTATTADTTYSIRIQCAAGAAVNGTTFAFGAVVTSKTPIAAATQALDFVTDYLSSSGLSGSAPYRGIRLTLSRQP